MLEIIIYIVIGIILGFIIGWFISKSKTNSLVEEIKTSNQIAYAELDKEFIAFKSTANSELQQLKQTVEERDQLLNEQKQTIQSKTENLDSLQKELATKTANFTAAKHNADSLKTELDDVKIKFNASNEKLATATANNKALDEKLTTQKDEIEALGKKFNTEFENIANKILETKSEKFTKLNSENLKTILQPLGENLKEFKKKVDDVYDKEAKERFSLGEKVKDLIDLSESLRKEAQNLTTALKADPKKQGGWGEMILERILEQSGLTNGREYFMENYLKDDNGNYLISEDGKKMRPDAIIQYPDERKVIIDSKVSINAYIRYVEAETSEEQKIHLTEHVTAIKNHVTALSNTGYEKFEKSLDYVMMFIPNEAAFMIALKEDTDLWQFAYKKRIVIISPTNLIVTLKIIEDLWKREYQNLNSKAIAERGMKLYDKFVLFTENFKKVGRHIESADSTYNAALKQLSSGNDNLVSQTLKMKALGVDSKKTLDPIFLEGNDIDEDEILKLNTKSTE